MGGVKLAFYKVPVPSSEDWQTKWASRIINWATGMRGIWHCELVFADNLCWTALMHGGTYFFRREHPEENWIVFELSLNLEQQEKVHKFCLNHCDIPYDFFGALGISLNFFREEKNKLFCSEACLMALQEVGIFENLPPSDTSPNFLKDACEWEHYPMVS